MEQANAFAASVVDHWRKRENLLPGSTMGAMEAMNGAKVSTMGGFVPFVLGWTAMMLAMMIPATLPLILLYRVVAHQRLSPVQARIGTAAMLVGYVAVRAITGLPVYVYALTAASISRVAGVVPAVLLVVGGVY